MKQKPRNHLNRISDEKLVIRFRKTGDPGIIGELYYRYVHLVYGVCIKFLKDREESRDAVMPETFPRFRGSRSRPASGDTGGRLR